MIRTMMLNLKELQWTKPLFVRVTGIAFFFLMAVPAIANNNLSSLGDAIFKDVDLSVNQNQACMTCHHPFAGFADPENLLSPDLFPVSNGSIPTLFGGRNAPSAAYAGFNPIFHYNGEIFLGGLFWDGRATGRMDVTTTGGLGTGPTGDPLADQAKGPFGNPVEMGLTYENTGVSTEVAVMGIIEASDYANKFKKIFGNNAFDDPYQAYNDASMAIAAFERSNPVNKFKSKFDKFLVEQGGDVSTFGVEVQADGFRRYVGPPQGFTSNFLSYDEADGLAIFNADSYTQLGITAPGGQNNGGMCYLCHLTSNHVVSKDDEFRPLNGPKPGMYPPLFTDFSFDNLGIPVNPQIAALAGPQTVDYGLGGQADQLAAACPDCDPGDEAGKFKVSSLRNLSRTAPYGHNGYFSTIYDIVHFYNTRDVLPECSGEQGDNEGITCWSPPEVPTTVNSDNLGNLGLSTEQEQKLIMFMSALKD